MDSSVVSDCLSGVIDNISCCSDLWVSLFDKVCILSVRNEADFMTIRFVSDVEFVVSGMLSNRTFRELAQRKTGLG